MSKIEEKIQWDGESLKIKNSKFSVGTLVPGSKKFPCCELDKETF